MTTSEGRLIELEAWGDTDVGMKRRLNEDVFLADSSRGLYLVADGMGGHAAGEVASRLAADEIVHSMDRLEQIADNEETWPDHWSTDRSIAANLLIDAIMAGHNKVTRAVNRDVNLKGMGTTVVAAVHTSDPHKIAICHVGDSRAYRFRESELQLLTQDHSWVHEQVSAGFLTEEAARTHPLKNVVTQALGGSSDPKVDILETSMQEGDLYLLCSDGLNSMLTDAEIAELMRQGGTLEQIGRRLIVAANERGGNDNITVVLLRPSVHAA